MKFRVIPSIAIALALFVPLSAVAAEKGVLVPREVFIGDTAEFSFRIDSPKSSIEPGSVFIVPAADVPVSPDLTIDSITVAREDASLVVTIRFVPWVSGTVRFPSFSLKKSRITPPPVRIGSLVEKTGKNTLQPPRAPLLVPGTTWLLFALVAVVVALLVIFLLAGFRIRKFLSRFPVWRLSNRRLRFVRKELRMLSRQLAKKSPHDWYSAYSILFRRYLGSFCRDEPSAFLPLTVTETVDSVASRLALHRNADRTDLLINRLHETLTRVDSIRFSGLPVEDLRRADLSSAMDFFLALEEVQDIPDGEADDAQL